MSWRSIYNEKLVSLEEAALKVESNDRVFFPPCSAAPIQLMETLADNYKNLENVDLFSALALHPFKFLQSPEYIGHLNYSTVFYGPYERAFYKAGNVNIKVAHLSEFDKCMVDFDPTVLMADVSLPDEEGYMYFGPMGVSSAHIAAEIADTVIVQVNAHQPKVAGTKHRIHVSDVTWICEHDHVLPELPSTQPSEVDQKIADLLIPHIEDGSCLQIGIGGLSNAIGFGLESKKDLSVHTEMFTDSMVYLAKKGVLSGKKVSGFGLGSKELYEYVGEGHVELSPIYEVNQPKAIAENDNFISINACLMTDLTGQVCSESIGFDQYSTTGGQVDYVRGASMSKGGKSFICLASTNTDKVGNVNSTIVTALPKGQVVTTARSDVMYIVTEYGIANLQNKSISERVEALLEIAHPDFREKLRAEAVEVGLLVK